MIEAILRGERDPEALVALVDAQVRKRKEERLRAALQGNWKKEHLFSLRQAYELWRVYQSKMAECDQQIAELLKEQSSLQEPPPPGGSPPAKEEGAPKNAAKIKALRHNAPQIENLHQMLLKLCGGCDATQLPGLTDYSVLTLVSEVGSDLSRWKTEKAFTAWLGLAPASHQSGKRRGRVSRQRNRAGRLFCTVARSLARSVDKALGGFYRRLRARRGGLIANQALARKLAELYWRVFVKGLHYVEAGLAKYQQQLAAQEQRLLHKLASKLGFTIQPLDPVHG